MPTTPRAPSLVPIALQLQRDLLTRQAAGLPRTAYPDPADLLRRCGGVESRVAMLVRMVRDMTHLPDFERPDGTVYVNKDHQPGMAVPYISTDTEGRLVMSNGQDALAFATVCSMARNWRYTKTRGYNELMALDNVIRRLPRTMRPAWQRVSGDLHAAFDPLRVLAVTPSGQRTVTGGAIAVALQGMNTLFTTLNAAEAAYISDLLAKAAA